jgi:hypothetical protein
LLFPFCGDVAYCQTPQEFQEFSNSYAADFSNSYAADFSNSYTADLSNSYAADLSNQNLPNGAVFLIVDGLGAYYVFSGLKPESLTGEVGTSAQLSVLPKICSSGF